MRLGSGRFAALAAVPILLTTRSDNGGYGSPAPGSAFDCDTVARAGEDCTAATVRVVG